MTAYEILHVAGVFVVFFAVIALMAWAEVKFDNRNQK